MCLTFPGYIQSHGSICQALNGVVVANWAASDRDTRSTFVAIFPYEMRQALDFLGETGAEVGAQSLQTFPVLGTHARPIVQVGVHVRHDFRQRLRQQQDHRTRRWMCGRRRTSSCGVIEKEVTRVSILVIYVRVHGGGCVGSGGQAGATNSASIAAL